MTADVDVAKPDNRALILLCQQAGWSRGEYNEIAAELNKLGCNCIAIDQRSGGEINDVINETNKRALLENKGTTYVDALVDLNSAIDYAKEKYSKASKLIIWGSSYSSALVLKVAGDRGDEIDAVLAFSPGEYFEKLGKPADWITQSAKKIERPVLITSAKMEKKRWWNISEAIPSENTAYFGHTKLGRNGSRALCKKNKYRSDY